MSTSESNLLDDKDEFQKGLPHGAFWGFIGCGKTYTHPNNLSSFTYIADREFKEKLKERAPKLMAHQKAFLASVGLGDIAEGVHAEGRVRKGQPKPRQTPLLRNTPQPASGNVKKPLI